ncbi:hypothetical protein JF732_18870 [Mycobacterium intracellulare]|uniref:Uncharacterized protein n=1 Tax=Mycobacterium intracellulare TaxID=1767 RepID=A0AAE4RF00_MYCIT|nr:hypothetical protein [Mycobacterium intracellulare]ETZ31174.1 hypothetical protein L842_2235 [Mycobacterium intracellulare MIN_052511_1280]MCA2320699.1 hypothetical protein [Mycobacterium intracellulare]MCA2342605.1 hypothetical protein [Mycobacterium intracellulare]MDV6978192.1 hypothetical protein [Mycobacterium intracellulare]MDV6983607.1 hypothetical protein [Mycobacterium intracellulare]
MPSAQLDDAKKAMSAIRAEFTSEVARIRTSNLYSDGGRRAEIAKALIKTRAKADALKANYSTDNEAKRAALSSKMFGLPPGADPATVMSHRDAADRAAQLADSDQAAATLKRALEHGDTVLARAVASHAHGKRWHDVTQTYAQTVGKTADLEALDDIPSGGLTKTAVNILFSVQTPMELQTVRGGCSPGELELIAEGKA